MDLAAALHSLFGFPAFRPGQRAACGAPPPPPPGRAARHALFGLPECRPGQREACEAALASRDVLVVMPTGSGKSLCYQLPALLRADPTLVVSPLASRIGGQGAARP